MATFMLLLSLFAFGNPSTGDDNPHGVTYLGNETCLDCHDTDVEAALELPHFKAMAGNDHFCESCHGSGVAHDEDPDVGNIPGPDMVAMISANCRSCHESAFQGSALRRPEHLDAGVPCLDCHVSGHEPAADKPLLNHAGDKACSSCHQDIVARMVQPFAHRSGSQSMACRDCHQTHASNNLEGLVAHAGSQSCASCHQEQAGPFAFPHAPKESCTSCHAPHGSPNPAMLIRANTTQLCLECHADTPVYHDLTQPRFQTCIDCHSAVHGSHRDYQLLKE